MDSYDYDIIIVGSGLYGAVTAWRAREKGGSRNSVGIYWVSRILVGIGK